MEARAFGLPRLVDRRERYPEVEGQWQREREPSASLRAQRSNPARARARKIKCAAVAVTAALYWRACRRAAGLLRFARNDGVKPTPPSPVAARKSRRATPARSASCR